MMLAQSLVEYSALESFTGAVQSVTFAVQDWMKNVDSGVLLAGTLLLVVWLGRRALSTRR